MLQQTRVETVVPYYRRFVERFPDVASLASATEKAVLQYWAGLGYYNRARNLRKAAVMIRDLFGGKFPEAPDDIARLPGVGKYTAGAICSIAFNRPVAAVDGNVRRVLARVCGKAGAPEAFIWQEASALVSGSRPSDFNQAMMELGALVCLPSDPLCGRCPVRRLCRAGSGARIPATPRRPRRSGELVRMVLLVIECGGRIAITPQKPVQYVPGDWGLPLSLWNGAGRPEASARRLARSLLGNEAALRASAPVRHAITHRVIVCHPYRTVIPGPPAHGIRGGHLVWVPREEVRQFLTSSLFFKALRAKSPPDRAFPRRAAASR
jgi:A/G-specific adenine glycosylase